METKNNYQSETKYGGFWARFLALILDSIVINACMALIYMVLGKKYGYPLNVNSANPISMFVSGYESYLVTLCQWIYNILMLKYYGATLGKMALRLRVVSKEGELDWVTVILRETVGKFVSAIILGIGYLMVVWDPRKQALHDKIAGTYVTIE